MDDELLEKDIQRLRDLQIKLKEEFGIIDIYSNSKIYEIIIANELGHTPIAGHSGTRNGKTENGEFEYKHYKERSSNHSWAFNDYSDTVIEGLKGAESVIFAHIDNDDESGQKFDWYIEVQGTICSDYLRQRTEKLLKEKPKGRVNARRMINFSPQQLMKDLKIPKTWITPIFDKGKYTTCIDELNEIVLSIEKNTGIKQILTSNKLWELVVSIPLKHQVLSEQSGHDAIDAVGNYYEYKVSTSHSWNFQDISETVLKKYESDKEIILGVIDKKIIKIHEIYIANSKDVVNLLRCKLVDKEIKYKKNGKELRRLSISLSKGDLKKVNARIFTERN